MRRLLPKFVNRCTALFSVVLPCVVLILSGCGKFTPATDSGEEIPTTTSTTTEEGITLEPNIDYDEGGEITGTSAATSESTVTEEDSGTQVDAAEPVVITQLPLPNLQYLVISGDGIAQASSGLDSNNGLVAITDTSSYSPRPGGERVPEGRERGPLQNLWTRFAAIIPTFTSSAQAADSSTTCSVDTPGHTVLTINTDGSLSAQEIAGTQINADIQFKYFDKTTCETSEAAIDRPNKYLVYTGQQSIAQTSDGTNAFFTDATGRVVQLSYNTTDQRFYAASGEFATEYLLGSYDAVTNIAYDSISNAFVFGLSDKIASRSVNVNETTGIFRNLMASRYPDYECFDGVMGECNSEYIDIGASAGCVPHGMVKVKAGKSYFATSCSSNYETGRIFELYKNSSNYIEFSNEDTSRIFFKSTKAFDVNVNSSGVTTESLVAFEDGSGIFKMYGNYFFYPTTTTQEATLSNAVNDILDLKILQPQQEFGSSRGKVALLRSGALIFYNYLLYCDGEETTCGTTATNTTGILHDTTVSISNSVSMTTNSDNSRIYVLSNSGDTTTVSDDYVTVVNASTQSVDTSVGTNGVIYLSELFSGKSLSDLNLNSINFFTSSDDKDHLLFGSNTLQSSLVMDLD